MRILFLTIALAAAALAQTQPFQHRVHLAAGMECAKCHAAAASSTRVDDNLLPKPEVCLECHKTAAIGTPRATRLARFNHQLHLKLGNIAPILAAAIDKKTYLSTPPAEMRSQLNTTNACAACHRGPDAAMPRMADCLVCHGEFDPPYSCEFCHGKGAKMAPASHAADFLDTHTTGKLQLDKTTCALCHGRKFHCLGCH